MLRLALRKEARAHGLSEQELGSHAEQVAAGVEDPYRLVPTLVARVFEARGKRGRAKSDDPDGLMTPTKAAIKIDHLGIAVESIAAARGFYEALGPARVDAGRGQLSMSMYEPPWFPSNESRIELLEPLREDSAVGRFLKERGPGTCTMLRCM